MAKLVLADAGPLIALAKVRQLDLLRQLFQQVKIAASVRAECLCKASDDSQVIKVALNEGWLESLPSPNPTYTLMQGLGQGEQDSIQIALQASEPALLILDDLLARKQARRFNLQFIGTATVVCFAEQRQLIQDAEDLVQQIRDVGYRIPQEVVAIIRQSLK